ncbi:MAG: protein mobD [Deltaproteobacteria bacterium]|jgi:MinD-like ATPase involved in chromosome partitioning or flagellar assembly|nr:protein mobD [Deltaproteobacteria bacterium]
MNGNQYPIYYVGGGKGGVGKSLFSFALTEYLLSQNRNLLLVDTDTDNPDVFKSHEGLGLANLHCLMNSLDSADGWADLLDTVQLFPEHVVLINAAARTKTSTANYGEIMQGALQEVGRTLTVFWLINRHRDSIELLHSFQQAFPDTIIHACRNLYFGEPERFDTYNGSKMREVVEQVGQTLDFPVVANRVTDWLYSKRMAIRAAIPEMPLGTRVELMRWRTRCGELFDRGLMEPKPESPKAEPESTATTPETPEVEV